jgi:hypothetical protein
VTGNHSTSTGPMSIALVGLSFQHSVHWFLGRCIYGFQTTPKNLMHNYIYIKVNCSVNKVVGLCPGLAFTGGAGVRNVNNFFRTRVWGFDRFFDDVPGIFRDFFSDSGRSDNHRRQETSSLHVMKKMQLRKCVDCHSSSR